MVPEWFKSWGRERERKGDKPKAVVYTAGQTEEKLQRQRPMRPNSCFSAQAVAPATNSLSGAASDEAKELQSQAPENTKFCLDEEVATSDDQLNGMSSDEGPPSLEELPSPPTATDGFFTDSSGEPPPSTTENMQSSLKELLKDTPLPQQMFQPLEKALYDINAKQTTVIQMQEFEISRLQRGKSEDDEEKAQLRELVANLERSLEVALRQAEVVQQMAESIRQLHEARMADAGRTAELQAQEERNEQTLRRIETMLTKKGKLLSLRKHQRKAEAEQLVEPLMLDGLPGLDYRSGLARELGLPSAGGAFSPQKHREQLKKLVVQYICSASYSSDNLTRALKRVGFQKEGISPLSSLQREAWQQLVDEGLSSDLEEIGVATLPEHLRQKADVSRWEICELNGLCSAGSEQQIQQLLPILVALGFEGLAALLCCVAAVDTDQAQNLQRKLLWVLNISISDDTEGNQPTQRVSFESSQSEMREPAEDNQSDQGESETALIPGPLEGDSFVDSDTNAPAALSVAMAAGSESNTASEASALDGSDVEAEASCTRAPQRSSEVSRQTERRRTGSGLFCGLLSRRPYH